MNPYAIWIRRGTGRLMCPALVGYLFISLLSQSDWRVELDWATRLSAGSLILIAPVVAAVAAFDTARYLHPTLSFLGRASVRGAGPIAFPAAAVVTWALIAYFATWTAAAAFVVLHGGVGVHDWWVFPEIAAPLVAAGAVGLLAGMIAGPRVAPIVAVMAIIVCLVIASPWGRSPFDAVTTYGTMTGLERPANQAAAAISGAFLLAAGAFSGAIEANRSGGGRHVILGTCVAFMTVAAVSPAALPWKEQVFRFTKEPYGCIGSTPAVCGPRSRLKLLLPVQRSLAEAYVKLSGTDFDDPVAFRVTRIDHYADLNGAAPLDFRPEDVRNGRYDNSAIVSALVRPHQCVGLLKAASAEPLLDAAGEIAPWLGEVLAGRASALPVPEKVSTAFKLIENCRPMTWNRL